MKNNLVKNLAIFTGISFSIFLLSFIVLAWDGPQTSPPAGNTPKPINLGTAGTSQRIEGGFNVGGVLVGDTGIIPNASTETQPTCDSSTEGMQWYDYSTKSLSVCNSIEWVSVYVSVYSMEVPVGAEGYDSSGTLVIAKSASGTLEDTAGQVVFLDAKNYGSLSTTVQIADVLVVAGGGGGGRGGEGTAYGGGGGAGGLIFKEGYGTGSTTYNVIVGSGGALGASRDYRGGNGGNSVFNSLTATGGGGGGSGWYNNSSLWNGLDGGSGGGGTYYCDSFGGSGIEGQGHDGAGCNSSAYGGGGGGAGSAGQVNSYGGEGLTIWGTLYSRGGGVHTSTSGIIGGGGTPGTKNGGGSAGNSGIVIVRWGGYDFDY